MSASPGRFSYKWSIVLGILAALCLLPVAGAIASGDGSTPTRGNVPSSVFDGSGRVDKSKVPDFIPALDRAGNQMGWVRRDDAMPEDANTGSNPSVPVYADDLTTVVGHMIPSRGFVPLGTPVTSVPLIPVVTGVSR